MVGASEDDLVDLHLKEIHWAHHIPYKWADQDTCYAYASEQIPLFNNCTLIVLTWQINSWHEKFFRQIRYPSRPTHFLKFLWNTWNKRTTLLEKYFNSIRLFYTKLFSNKKKLKYETVIYNKQCADCLPKSHSINYKTAVSDAWLTKVH